MILLELVARSDIARREIEGRAWLAWHVAALTGCDPKKFPRAPSALVPKPKGQATATAWRTMDADALSWVVNSGGTVLPG